MSVSWGNLPDKVTSVTNSVTLGDGLPNNFANSLQLFGDKNKFPVTHTCNSGLPSIQSNNGLGIG